jgi:hypothetical protein
MLCNALPPCERMSFLVVGVYACMCVDVHTCMYVRRCAYMLGRRLSFFVVVVYAYIYLTP